MRLTVQEHLDKSRNTHREGQEIAGVLGDLKDVVEQILLKFEDKIKNKDFFDFIDILTLALSRFPEIFENLELRISRFEKIIPDIVSNLGFELEGDYNLSTPHGKVKYDDLFKDRVLQSLNPIKSILGDLKAIVEELNSIIENAKSYDINDENTNSKVENDLDRINKLLARLKILIFNLYLGDKSYVNMYDFLNEDDEERYIPHPVLPSNWHLDSFDAEKNIMDWQITKQIPLWKKVKAYINNEEPTLENPILITDIDGIVNLMNTYLIKKFLETKDNNYLVSQGVFIELYKECAKLRKSLEEIQDFFNETPKEGPITSLFNLCDKREQIHRRNIQERLNPNLAIIRLTEKIAKIVEQISLVGELSPNIEQTLQKKADEERQRKRLEEQLAGASPDQ